MMVSNRGSVVRLVMWQWRFTLWAVLGSTLVVLAYQRWPLAWIELPAMPVSVVGATIGIFVSFRTNSAYGRWWEGRQLWGRLINTSRHIASQSVSFLRAAPAGTTERLVRRQVAYVHALRCLLRQQDPFADAEFLASFSDPAELDGLRGESNLTHALLQRHLDDAVALNDAGVIDAFRLQGLDESVRHLLDIQGGCERIKKTPFPRGYGFIAEQLILVYTFLFPLSLVHELGVLSIPVSVLVCLSFALIGEAGRVLEDPFTMFWNGLPLAAMSRTIERNLLQRIGVTDLPPELTPDEQGILM